MEEKDIRKKRTSQGVRRFAASLEPLDFSPQEENGPSYLHHAQTSGFRVRPDLSENLSGEEHFRQSTNTIA